MVLPEIDHHFLQLTFRINRSKHAVRGYLRLKLVCLSQVVFLIIFAYYPLPFLPVLFGHFLRVLYSISTLESLEQRTRIRILGKNLSRRHVEDLKICRLLFSNAVIDLQRLKLLIHIFSNSERLDLLNVTGPRPESEPVEDV